MGAGRGYDEKCNQITQVGKSGSDGLLQRTLYAFDERCNVTPATIDAGLGEGRKIAIQYNPQGRPVEIRDSLNGGFTIRFTYHSSVGKPASIELEG